MNLHFTVTWFCFLQPLAGMRVTSVVDVSPFSRGGVVSLIEEMGEFEETESQDLWDALRRNPTALALLRTLPKEKVEQIEKKYGALTESMTEKHRALEAQLRNHKAEIPKIKQAQSTAEMQMRQHERSQAALQKTFDKTTADKEAVEFTLESLREQSEQARAEEQDLVERIQKLRQQSAALKAKAKTQEKVVEKMIAQWDASQQKVKKGELELEDVRERVEKQENILKKNEEAIEVVEDHLDEVNQERKQLPQLKADELAGKHTAATIVKTEHSHSASKSSVTVKDHVSTAATGADNLADKGTTDHRLEADDLLTDEIIKSAGSSLDGASDDIPSAMDIAALKKKAVEAKAKAAESLKKAKKAKQDLTMDDDLLFDDEEEASMDMATEAHATHTHDRPTAAKAASELVKSPQDDDEVEDEDLFFSDIDDSEDASEE